MSNRPLTKTEWLASLEKIWEAAQQPRPWVGLTEEDCLAALTSVDSLTARLPIGFKLFARAIEAKLKAKNDH